jgi:hypothetical protein
MQIVAAVLDAAPSAVTAQDLSGTPLHTHSRARALTHTYTYLTHIFGVTAQDLSGSSPLHTNTHTHARTHTHTNTHTHTHTHIQAVPHYISWRVTLN